MEARLNADVADRCIADRSFVVRSVKMWPPLKIGVGGGGYASIFIVCGRA